MAAADLARSKQAMAYALCKHLKIDPSTISNTSIEESDIGSLFLRIVNSSQDEVMKWVKFSNDFTMSDGKQHTLLDKLNQELSWKFVLLGDGLKPSVADIAVFATIQPFMSRISGSELQKYLHVLHWMEYIQDIVDFGTALQKINVTKPVFDPSSHPKKADKGGAEASQKKTVSGQKIADKSNGSVDSKKTAGEVFMDRKVADDDISTRTCADLKDDTIRHICSLLSCRLDRSRMAAAYPSWRAAINQEAHMLQVLPVLYVPRTLSPSFSCLSCNDGCHMDLPAFALESRCIGSHDAGWLFLARNHCQDHILWDSVNGQLIKVPDGMRFSEGGVEDLVIIHCAAISGTPKTTVPIQQCIGAALVDRIVPDLVPKVKVADIMFWSLDRTVGWGSQDFLLDVAKDGAVDVIYFNGSFHILTIGEVIIVANPRFGIHGLELKEDDIWSLGIVSAYKEDQDQVRTLEARYLVESRGGLLMVKRYRQNSSTISCRVFSLDLKGRGSAPEYDRWVWSEVIDLEGRMIFLSSGCSRSFEYRDYDQYPNAKEGFYFKGDVERVSQDWEAMNEISRQQLVSDTGLWDDPLFGRHSRCYRIPQQLPGTFPHSAPAWVLPPLF